MNETIQYRVTLSEELSHLIREMAASRNMTTEHLAVLYLEEGLDSDKHNTKLDLVQAVNELTAEVKRIADKMEGT